MYRLEDKIIYFIVFKKVEVTLRSLLSCHGCLRVEKKHFLLTRFVHISISNGLGLVTIQLLYFIRNTEKLNKRREEERVSRMERNPTEILEIIESSPIIGDA